MSIPDSTARSSSIHTMTHVSNSQVQEITGLFSDFDIDLMRIMLDANRALVDTGDLAELGVHLGGVPCLSG